MIFARIAAVAAAFVCAAGVNAATFDFSYELESGQVLAGIVSGDLQGDNDTVIVSSISSVSFGGAPATAFPFVDSATNYPLSSGTLPTLTLSGTFLDFIACTSAVCFDGFLFDTTGSISGFQLFNSGPGLGEALEQYSSARYSLTPRDLAPIPLPAGALLLLGSLGGFAALRRRAA
jgi:hypothetical protein